MTIKKLTTLLVVTGFLIILLSCCATIFTSTRTSIHQQTTGGCNSTGSSIGDQGCLMKLSMSSHYLPAALILSSILVVFLIIYTKLYLYQWQLLVHNLSLKVKIKYKPDISLLFNNFIELFSQGILHPKLYSL